MGLGIGYSTISATAHIINSRTILRVDMGFYIGIISMPLLNSLYRLNQ